MSKTIKILAETDVGSAEEQPARDKLMHVLTVLAPRS
jgi:hypothetical protein